MDDQVSIRGINIFPSDIESQITYLAGVNKTVMLKVNSELVLVVESIMNIDFEKLSSEILKLVLEEINIAIDKIFFVRNNMLPRTSSGKIKRRFLVSQLLNNSLKTIGTYTLSLKNASRLPSKEQFFEKWMRSWLVMKTDCNELSDLENRNFSDFGLDSLSAFVLIADIKEAYKIDILSLIHI